MSKDNKTANADAEAIKKDEGAEDEIEGDEAEGADSDENEDSAGDKNADNSGIDFDAEIEAETKRGKPDPSIAKEAFKGRKQKRDGSADDAGDEGAEGEDDDKPVTKSELKAFETKVRRDALSGQALSIAQTLAGNHSNAGKEAQLIVAKWSNRTFPDNMPLSEQIEECYAIVHRKKLVGERNEALRALKGKDGVGKNAASSHRDAPAFHGKKVTSAEATAFKASGYVLNVTTQNWEKKLANGDMLVRDSKTGKTAIVKKTKN